MQNIYAILAKYNLTIPEDKKAAFDTAFGENYKTVAELEKVRNSRDNYKDQALQKMCNRTAAHSKLLFFFSQFGILRLTSESARWSSYSIPLNASSSFLSTFICLSLITLTSLRCT